MSESKDESLVDYYQVPKTCPKCGCIQGNSAFMLRGYGVRAVMPTGNDGSQSRMQEFLAWGCKDCGFEVLSTTLDNSGAKKHEQEDKASTSTAEEPDADAGVSDFEDIETDPSEYSDDP